MAREPRLALEHVLEAILEIEQFARGKTIVDYRSDRLLRRGVERCIEIISEASRSIPDDFKADHPDLPWRDIASIGNRLRHNYDDISEGTLWNVVTVELDRLKSAIEAMAAKHGIDLYSDE
jgi:uncharacterized protein with HEPN domain